MGKNPILCFRLLALSFYSMNTKGQKKFGKCKSPRASGNSRHLLSVKLPVIMGKWPVFV